MRVLLLFLFATSAQAELAEPHTVPGLPPTVKSQGRKAQTQSPSGHHNAANLFCRDPYAAVCFSMGGAEKRLEEARVALGMRKEAQQRAEGAALKKLRYPIGDASARSRLYGVGPEPRGESPRSPNTNYKLYLKSLYSQVQRSVNPKAPMERIKKAVLATIASQDLSPEKKAELTARIQGTSGRQLASVPTAASSRPLEVVDGSEAIMRLVDYDPVRESRGQWDPNFLADFQAECGVEGMSKNAYYRSDLHAVVLCPGFLLSMGQGGVLGGSIDLPPLTMVESHEIAHALNQPSPGQTANYLNCLRKTSSNFPKDFEEELAADVWSAETIAQMMTGDKNASALFLIRSARSLCDTEKDDHHPSGRYRIENVLGRNQSIREKLNCSDSKSSSTCRI